MLVILPKENILVVTKKFTLSSVTKENCKDLPNTKKTITKSSMQ